MGNDVKRDGGLRLLGEAGGSGTDQLRNAARKAGGPRIPRTAILSVNTLDSACRSVPPATGRRHVNRYAGRNLVAEALASLYGEESRAALEQEHQAADQGEVVRQTKSPERDALLRKARGDKACEKGKRKRNFFGF